MATGSKQEKAKYRKCPEKQWALHRRHFSRLRLVFTPSEGAAGAHSTRRLTESSWTGEDCGFKRARGWEVNVSSRAPKKETTTQTCSRGQKSILHCPKPSPITYFPQKMLTFVASFPNESDLFQLVLLLNGDPRSDPFSALLETNKHTPILNEESKIE